ncbi:uncharacterized protein WM277_011788 [Molossus nigricans]
MDRVVVKEPQASLEAASDQEFLELRRRGGGVPTWPRFGRETRAPDGRQIKTPEKSETVLEPGSNGFGDWLRKPQRKSETTYGFGAWGFECRESGHPKGVPFECLSPDGCLSWMDRVVVKKPQASLEAASDREFLELRRRGGGVPTWPRFGRETRAPDGRQIKTPEKSKTVLEPGPNGFGDWLRKPQRKSETTYGLGAWLRSRCWVEGDSESRRRVAAQGEEGDSRPDQKGQAGSQNPPPGFRHQM